MTLAGDSDPEPIRDHTNHSLNERIVKLVKMIKGILSIVQLLPFILLITNIYNAFIYLAISLFCCCCIFLPSPCTRRHRALSAGNPILGTLWQLEPFSFPTSTPRSRSLMAIVRNHLWLKYKHKYFTSIFHYISFIINDGF